MTAPAPLPPWPENAALLLRLVYQRAKVLANLPNLVSRALQDTEITAGRSEFAVADSEEAGGAGWDGDLIVLPRTYSGYVAVHYPATTDQRETFPDEARLTAALATFTEDARARQIEGLREFGLVPARWFLNDRPVKVMKPSVLTLEITWTLGVDLRIPAEFLNPHATGGKTP